MAEIALADAQQSMRDLFNKGLVAFERGNLDYALDMFLTCLENEPGILEVRKFVRAAEIKKYKSTKKSKVAHHIATVVGLPHLVIAIIKTKIKKADEALKICETLLRQDPLNLNFIMAFCNAAEASELPEAAVQTLEIAKDHYPKDLDVLARLGFAYLTMNRAKDAHACFEVVLETKSDAALRKALKDSIILESMSKDGWDGASKEEGADYRDLLKDSDEAELLETEGKVVKSDDDLDALIADHEAKIEAEPENTNYYRALANLYSDRHMYDESVTTLTRIIEILGTSDPEIESTLGTTKLNKYQYDIAQLVEAGDQAAAESLTTEMNTFYFSDITERSRKYPGDLQLRYELGAAYYERSMLNEAIQQFQHAQGHPHWKVNSLYYLGLCFKAKQQYDLASEQLIKAAEKLPTMDDTKKGIYYELGLIEEEQDNAQKARDYFKEVYQSDISFRDVAQKVEQGYSGNE
jgi:tetratricopeptide (TPR) repeat protein